VITTILILLPIASALAIWVFPWPSTRAAGSFALLVALAELALWVGTALNFDFGATGLQAEADVTWFSDLDVAYQVGLYDYSLWLIGLTAGSASSVAYGSGRAGAAGLRGHAALARLDVGVFPPRTVVFYVFFEAMLIPCTC
jgi:NADH-quinone oxidoreductase subunit M